MDLENVMLVNVNDHFTGFIFVRWSINMNKFDGKSSAALSYPKSLTSRNVVPIIVLKKAKSISLECTNIAKRKDESPL